MIVIVVIGLVLIATAGAQMMVVRRRNVDPLVRQERAIAALRDVAEHPHPLVADPHPELPPTRNIRILDEPPADAAARRRRARRAAAARRRAETPMHPANIASRPTAAQLPTRPETILHIPAEDFGGPELPPAVPALPSVDIEPTHLRESRTRSRPPHGHVSRRVKVGAILTTGLAVAVAAVVAFAPSGGGSTKGAASTVPTSPPPPTPTTKHAPATTATTPPAVQVVAAPGGISGTVVVAVPFTLAMTTSAPCWVMVQTNTGQTLFEGTLLAGQSKSVSGAGPLTIRMGNTSAMQMTLNGTPLDLAGMAKTANVQFNPA